MLSGPDISSAQGPALLYAANLLGILIVGITVLAIREPYFRDKLRRRRGTGKGCLRLAQLLGTKSSPKLPGGGAIIRPQAAELQAGSEHSRHDQQQTCRAIPWP